MPRDRDKDAAMTVAMPKGIRVTKLGSDLAVIEFPMPILKLPPELTVAEQEVAVLVYEGATNGEIAEARGASVKTVGNQLGSIFRKLGVASRVELVIYLQRGPGEGE